MRCAEERSTLLFAGASKRRSHAAPSPPGKPCGRLRRLAKSTSRTAAGHIPTTVRALCSEKARPSSCCAAKRIWLPLRAPGWPGRPSVVTPTTSPIRRSADKWPCWWPHCARAGSRPPISLLQRARHRHAQRRSGRMRSVADGVGGGCPAAMRQLDQGGARTTPGRRRGTGGDGDGLDPAGRRSAANGRGQHDRRAPRRARARARRAPAGSRVAARDKQLVGIWRH